MRPHTPSIDTTQVDVTSPPETPPTGSPTSSRRTGKGRSQRPSTGRGPRSSLPPLGGVDSHFSHTRGFCPEEISPRSSDSSEDDSDSSVSPPQSPLSDIPEIRPLASHTTRAHVAVTATFEIEECSDQDEDGDDNMLTDDGDVLDVLRPHSFEDAESERSRSRTRSEQDVDPQLMGSLQDLTCFSSEESDIDLGDDEEEDNDFTRGLRQQRLQKKARRMTSGSISKRTVSERGSDSDREDLQPWDHGEPVQRRLRRKIERRSVMSIPPEIIIELKEPNSDGEYDEWDEALLAQELPFWQMVDSD